MMETTKLSLQNAADAAAIGAVFAYQDGSTLAAGGAADAKLNGFVDGSNNATVTISSPPTSGAYQGSPSAVQATLTQKFTPAFSPVSFQINAQATAQIPVPPCVYLLSQYSTQPSLDAINETITGSCPFYIGSSYYFNGGSGSTGNQFLLHGSTANSSGSVSPTPIGSGAMGDPLNYIPPPPFGSCQYINKNVTSATTLQPGTYCGGLTIITSSAVTLSPGLYVIAGNLSINGPNLTGAGITFFMTQGGGYSYGVCTISNVNARMSAPTTGTWQGILFFSDRNMPAGQMELFMSNWNPSSKLDGILYLVGQELRVSNIPLQGNNYFGIVADWISINNTGFTPSANYSTLANGNPFHVTGSGIIE
jgi:hypothetical protein